MNAQLMLDLCDNIEGKSFCPLGDAAAWPIQFLIKKHLLPLTEKQVVM